MLSEFLPVCFFSFLRRRGQHIQLRLITNTFWTGNFLEQVYTVIIIIRVRLKFSFGMPDSGLPHEGWGVPGYFRSGHVCCCVVILRPSLQICLSGQQALNTKNVSGSLSAVCHYNDSPGLESSWHYLFSASLDTNEKIIHKNIAQT